jgi:tetrahydromethanopterin S-methyltransferase subunit E
MPQGIAICGQARNLAAALAFFAKSPPGRLAMVDTLDDPHVAAQELRAHLQTFHGFSKLVLFAILHIGLVLACLALAFVGNSPLIALILGVGGTAALIAAFAVF